jgi:hypothetical protein
VRVGRHFAQQADAHRQRREQAVQRGLAEKGHARAAIGSSVR